MKNKDTRVWVILEQTIVKGEPVYKPLAGTEDEKAINAALFALKEYKDKKIRNGELDLTDIRTSVVEKINPINQILEQDDDDTVDRLMSMVD